MRDSRFVIVSLVSSLLTLGLLLQIRPIRKASERAQPPQHQQAIVTDEKIEMPIVADAAEDGEDENSPSSFTFNAFGDSGWARTHVHKPVYFQGFKAAYMRFDSQEKLIGDLNYLNWETSVGKSCKTFWSLPTPQAFAFLTRPEELADALSLGFNMIGLANNHSHDCTQSEDGSGILQSIRLTEKLREQEMNKGNPVLTSGVFSSPEDEPATDSLLTSEATIPVKFLSAYVGGNASRCINILCDTHLQRYAAAMKNHQGLRVLALHSWDDASHLKLKSLSRRWIDEGLADIALGTGPHVAEEVELIQTQKGFRVLATSLGNFIHPNLKPQKNNIVLRTKWKFDAENNTLDLQWVKTTQISCAYESCRKIKTRRHPLPADLESASL